MPVPPEGTPTNGRRATFRLILLFPTMLPAASLPPTVLPPSKRKRTTEWYLPPNDSMDLWPPPRRVDLAIHEKQSRPHNNSLCLLCIAQKYPEERYKTRFDFVKGVYARGGSRGGRGWVVRAGSNTHAKNVEELRCEMRGIDSLPVRYYFLLASTFLLTYRQAFTLPFCDFEAAGNFILNDHCRLSISSIHTDGATTVYSNCGIRDSCHPSCVEIRSDYHGMPDVQ